MSVLRLLPEVDFCVCGIADAVDLFLPYRKTCTNVLGARGLMGKLYILWQLYRSRD
jgi:hypothetical protein